QRKFSKDTFKELSIYFPKEQWAEMKEFEKTRYKNMKQNYEFMIQLGEINYWKLRKDHNIFDVLLFSVCYKILLCVSVQRKIVSGKTRNRKTEQKEHVITYSLRKREKKAYMEINEPSDDDYLFCEYCQIFFLDVCSVHGSPVFIKDAPAEIGLEKRAILTLPPGLRVGPSGIPKAGLGIWNEGEILLPGIHFGPYEGTITEDEEAANSGYSWLITKGRGCCVYTDGQDETKSNWMRYVNCARNEDEQNLVAFQYHGEIYYRVCKTILLHSELLVWYGEEYGRELGIKWGSGWQHRNKCCQPLTNRDPRNWGSSGQ
uniref:Uncharacterized protein n=1 Tax=Salvator merianae TaxID=96440 RepID=A0A8D0BER4_SALMN